LLRQQVFEVAPGHEDLNDHTDQRHDPALQTASGRDRALASAPTLCRFENRLSAGDPRGSGRELYCHLRGSRRKRSCWTSMRRTMRCTAIRIGASSKGYDNSIATDNASERPEHAKSASIHEPRPFIR